MSTQINVIVDDGGLSAKAKQQIQANRWQNLEEAQRAKVAQKAQKQRDAQRLQNGIGLDGRPVYGAPVARSLRREEPAAQRISPYDGLLLTSSATSYQDAPADVYPPADYPYHPIPMYFESWMYATDDDSVRWLGNAFRPDATDRFKVLPIIKKKGLKDDFYLFAYSKAHAGGDVWLPRATGGPGGGSCLVPGSGLSAEPSAAVQLSVCRINRSACPPQLSGDRIIGKAGLDLFPSGKWVWTEEAFVRFSLVPLPTEHSRYYELALSGMFGGFRVFSQGRKYAGSPPDFQDYYADCYLNLPYLDRMGAIQGTTSFGYEYEWGDTPRYPLLPVAGMATTPEWYHVAWVSDGSQVSFYFAGHRVAHVSIPPDVLPDLKTPELGYVTGYYPPERQSTYATRRNGYEIGAHNNSFSDQPDGSRVRTTPALGTGISFYYLGVSLWHDSATGLPEVEVMRENTGVAQYRFTVNQARYKGERFTPPTEILTL